ncbi:MAG: cell division protein ZapA [Alphaproteobacteria bacterium]|nr:MAG: cell division protein ZapA [Alphaproteobacteria bacterium]
MTDQTIVKIEVNSKFYPISCKIGEEDRVIASGKLLSEIISTLEDKENKISESKILLMAALILADKNLRNTNETSEIIGKEDLDLYEVVLWLEKLNLKFKNIESLINNS